MATHSIILAWKNPMGIEAWQTTVHEVAESRTRLSMHSVDIYKLMCASSAVSNSFEPMDCSQPDSSVHGTFQARTLEWVAISSSRGSSQPRDQTPCVFYIGR